MESTQKSTLGVFPWVVRLLDTLARSIEASNQTLNAALIKTRFWQTFGSVPMNERQVLMMNRLLDGFEGKLAAKKWATITKCSPDTALRDINDLIKHGALIKSVAGGRSTSYELAR